MPTPQDLPPPTDAPPRAPDEMTVPPGPTAAKTVDPPDSDVRPPGTVVQGEESARSAALRIGSVETPPGYELLGELGRGGMGVVYRARQVALDRVVALKMILAGELAGEAERARFRAEARAVAALRHPNIVQVYETGEVAGQPYLALEYCPGGTLAGIVRDRLIPPRRAAELVEPVARAVGAAHARGIVHRDLKPANVLIADDGGPKVADFGLAKRVDAADGITGTWAVLGTPAYMAPEQAAGKKAVGPPADVYALGVILYELLTGRPPFSGGDADALLELIKSHPPEPPRNRAPAVPRDLERVCLKCLEKEPRDRYPTATELADDLRRFLDSRPTLARPLGRLTRAARWVRRNPVLSGLAAVAAVLAVALAVLVAAPRREPLSVTDGPPREVTDDDVLAVAEELDRTDPGWRLEEMDKARKKIPPAENSAPLIDEADAALPPDDQDQRDTRFRQRVKRFQKRNDALPPTAPLPDEFRVRKEPDWPAFEKALAAARRVADRPYGRFPITWSRDAVGTLLPHPQRARDVATLLQWDAVSAASAGDPDAALADCRGCVNAGRSLHDEPTAVSQLVRIACGHIAVRTAERVLALGPAPDKELAALAELLRLEDAAPIFPTMARATRGFMHWFYLAATAGDLKLSPGASPEDVEEFKRMPRGAAARPPHVWVLRHLTRLVEISRLPPHEQAGPLKDWEESSRRDAPPGADAWSVGALKLGNACRRHTAYLRSTIAAITCERYRMANGGWPEKLADLVPEYLPAVPLDPEDGRPLRFKRLPDGLVVYGIGANGKDDGGSTRWPAPDQLPADFGFRLWDPELRGKPGEGP